MATQTRFAEISFEEIEEIEEIKDKAIPQNTKHATKYGVKLWGVIFKFILI